MLLYWHPKSGGAERRIGELVNVDLRLNCAQLLFRIDEYYFEADSVSTSKPYLRQMSSMTEEEKSTYMKLRAHALPFSIVEWLDKNHFDHRTNKDGEHLIEIGLALEAKEGMYKTE